MTTEDLLHISERIPHLKVQGGTMESAARAIVEFLHHSLLDANGNHASVLTRLYKTHPYGTLPRSLKRFVGKMLGEHTPTDGLKNLTLLATRGEEASWNDRTTSVGHQAIPLIDSAAISDIPMVARLVDEFGLDAGEILDPKPGLILDLEQKKYQVFFVEEALGSPFIPAQEGFVRRYGVRSVVGFGGVLPSGDLFAVIVFSREKIERSLAEDFALLVLPIKMTLLPFVFGNIFETDPS